MLACMPLCVTPLPRAGQPEHGGSWKLVLGLPPTLPSLLFLWQLICFQQPLIFRYWFSLGPRPCSIFVSRLLYLLSFPHV